MDRARGDKPKTGQPIAGQAVSGQPASGQSVSARSGSNETGTRHPVAAQRTDLIKLSMLPGIGPRTLTALLDRFDDAGGVFAASDAQLAEVPGVGSKLVHTIRTAHHHVSVDSIIRWCEENETQILCQDKHVGQNHLRGPGTYPHWLSNLSDAPPILFSRGSITTEDEIAVAIVGTRHATLYGLKQAERFAYALASAGVTVVSGLARGIDGAAHEGALNGGGRTLAVLGGGLNQVYPSEHRKLADAVAADGAVISEYAPDAKPRGGMFPQRNRLIAGLSLATLVIEAPDRSGALITARLAGEQNREVLALPGPVTSRASRGCNRLIRDGATLVQNIDDVLEALGPMKESVTTEDGRALRNVSELSLNEIERAVLDAIEETGTPIDHVIAKCQLPAHRVIATVSVLEMRRLIRRLSGQYVSRI